MWTCAQCGRSFERTNQDHYCGEPPATIDAYIDAQPEAVRDTLRAVRKAIRSAAPDAAERISWRMPTFWQGENLIHFAAFKKHIGIYPGDLTLTPFKERLEQEGYHTTKGAIQFPLNKPIDYALIEEITRYRVDQAQSKHPRKQMAAKDE